MNKFSTCLRPYKKRISSFPANVEALLIPKRVIIIKRVIIPKRVIITKRVHQESGLVVDWW